jgi:hypothetical protein
MASEIKIMFNLTVIINYNGRYGSEMALSSPNSREECKKVENKRTV